MVVVVVVVGTMRVAIRRRRSTRVTMMMIMMGVQGNRRKMKLPERLEGLGGVGGGRLLPHPRGPMAFFGQRRRRRGAGGGVEIVRHRWLQG